MGGFGSGHRGSKKAVAEGCTTIDTGDLKRLKLLRPGLSSYRGSLEWRRSIIGALLEHVVISSTPVFFDRIAITSCCRRSASRSEPPAPTSAMGRG